jgi:Tfp pilus assembly protein PilV
MKMPSTVDSGRQAKTGARAFSLLEVMIAMAIFFVAIVSILDLVSQGLSSARRLQFSHVDASTVAAALSLTNRLEEGGLPSDIVAQFEELNPGFSCAGNIFEVSSNGLFQVDLEVRGVRDKKVVGSTMSIMLYRAGSARSVGGRLGR